MMGFAGCSRFFGGMGFMGGNWLLGIALLLILVAILLFTSRNRHNQPEAIKILDSEYAKGNVSDADYQKRKDNLMH